MTTENVNPEDQQEKNGKDLDPVKLKELADNLQAERDKLAIELRGLKSTAGEAAKMQKQLDDLLTEKSKLMSTIEEMKTAQRDEKLSTHLKTALESMCKKNGVTTAMKLIDRSKIEFDKDGQIVQKSIDDAIAAVKVSDPILFEVGGAEDEGKKGSTLPDVQRAAQASGGKSDYQTELAEARKKRDGGKALQDVLRKYGKL